MVVEKRVLIKVVLPNPDSPATFTIDVSSILYTIRVYMLSYHDSESGTPLSNNLVSLVWQVGNANRRRALGGGWRHVGGDD